MKIYKTKRELKAVIRAVQKSLNSKWKLENKKLGKDVLKLRCPLCVFPCTECPLYYNDDTSVNLIFKCGKEFNQFVRFPTPANFMAMRRKLQAVKRQLIKQLEAR